MPDDHRKSAPSPRRWSELRFAIIGPLLAAPPPRGELGQRLTELSRMTWRHPTTGAPVKFGASTIERWLGRARAEPRDRVAVLARRLRKDRGTQPTCTDHLCQVLRAQYRDHTGWTMKLHFDNLRALADKDPALHPLPSYSTVVRFMKAHDLVRRQTVGPRLSLGAQQAAHRLLACEVRSYEAEYTNQLWHSDYHTSKRTPVLLGNGRWKYPVCLCVMDDHSRLCCHVQWYLDEEAETFAHGLGQAFQKRGLPRGLLSDSVPRHRIRLLCPCVICGQAQAPAGMLRDGPRLPPHNIRGQRESSQVIRAASVCHGGLRARPCVRKGEVQVSRAAALVRRLISA